MKILIAIDDSKCSERVVEFVCKACNWKDTDELMVLSVVEPLPREFTFLRINDCDIGDYNKQIEKAHKKLVDSAAERIKSKLNNDNITTKIANGMVAPCIVQTAENWNANLIVMGSHGGKGFRRMIIGSVAEEVLRKASCTVEIVKESTVIPD